MGGCVFCCYETFLFAYRKSSEIDATDISEPVKKTEVAVDTLPEAKGFTAAVTKVVSFYWCNSFY